MTGERRFFAYSAPYSTRSILLATAERGCCIGAAGREFMDARRLESEAVALGKITDQNLPNEVIARGRFLFGDEVLAKLGELHRLCTSLLTNDHHAPSQMSAWHDEFHHMMRPYMSLGDLKT